MSIETLKNNTRREYIFYTVIYYPTFSLNVEADIQQTMSIQLVNASFAMVDRYCEDLDFVRTQQNETIRSSGVLKFFMILNIRLSIKSDLHKILVTRVNIIESSQK